MSYNPTQIQIKLQIHASTFAGLKKTRASGRDASYRTALANLEKKLLAPIPGLIEQYAQLEISFRGAEMLEKYIREVISNRELICKTKKGNLPAELQTILNVLYVAAPLYSNKSFDQDLKPIQKMHPSTQNLAVPKEILVFYKMRELTSEEVLLCFRQKMDRRIWTDQVINAVFGNNPKYSPILNILLDRDQVIQVQNAYYIPQ
ncbi:hypothetical protein GPJ56_001937 [Histomonas meleagridis]|uniref:uncharacterized protein n=1 Tax=Histomonas meleagridis TaxID=135588 RepID=UPI00355A0200|nr:hypothetical protein GPJ56_001937 [Histomonas meleagridis]KAH0800987.1 hypothetical protein GO595_006303 [Histomonas meleagridis]